MTQPRQHIYTFAHRVLVQDAHGEPSLWNIITGDKAYGYLQQRWADAGAGDEPMTGMLFVEPIRVAGLDIALLRMPDPQAPTEPYFVAFVRPVRGGAIRYFVLERSSAGGAFWAEWRAGGMRIRGADVPEYPADLAARTALPYPYAATFVDAIVAEAGSAGGTSTRNKVLVGIGVVAIMGIAVVLGLRDRNDGTSASELAPPTPTPTPTPTAPRVEEATTGGFANQQRQADAAAAAAEKAASKPAEKPAEKAASKPAEKPAEAKKPAAKPTKDAAGIEPSVITSVMRRNFGRFRLCYENELLRTPSLAGTITVTFTINNVGTTTQISTSGLPEVAACITSVIKNMSFPNRSGKPQKVVYPVKFVAGG